MPSKAKRAFLKNQEDLTELWNIHEQVAGEGPGRKHGVEVLNRATIIFVTACWESYIEDLATEAFDALLAGASSATALPAKVRTLATKSIWDQKDASKVWDIADGGWRTLLAGHRKATLQHWLGTFNTPMTDQVNALYLELVGLKNLSSNWAWAGMNSAKAEAKLDKFIKVRGDIAHRLTPGGVVHKGMGRDYLNHVTRISETCELAVRSHLVAHTGVPPW